MSRSYHAEVEFLIIDKDKFYELIEIIDPPELSWASNAVDFFRMTFMA